jgi:hypothetical protein
MGESPVMKEFQFKYQFVLPGATKRIGRDLGFELKAPEQCVK